jgi:hypothetical protein
MKDIFEMNSQIKLLWNEAASTTDSDSWDAATRMMERFAQLVVKETITEICQQMLIHGDDQSNNPVMYKAINSTMKRFGIDK